MLANRTVKIRLAFALAVLALVIAFIPILGRASTGVPPQLLSSGGNGPATQSDKVGANQPQNPNPITEIEKANSEPLDKNAAIGSVVVGQSLKNDVSPPLRDIKPKPLLQGATAPENEANREVVNKGFVGIDPVLQTIFNPLVVPAPIVEFEGIDNISGLYPPDTQGDVGLNHYVQWVNISFAVYTKKGDLVLGPLAGNTIWDGFGGQCEANNHGDPITLYDQLADRWFMSQFATPGGANGYHQCIAISTTGDPTGSYYRYDFLISNTVVNDYPKFGIWPDGYYMSTVNISGGAFVSSYAIAFNRSRMLLGLSSTTQLFTVSDTYERIIPTDLDGFTLPPSGTPNIFASVVDPNDLNLWEFNVDWDTPGNTTFTGPTTLTTANFDSDLCANVRERCINQPGTAIELEALVRIVMYRLAYRNLGTHQSLVANHTVDADGAGRAGVRWYEVRSPASAPFIHQQSTYSPNSDHRWMGSVAMDRKGNMGLGYSRSSTSTFPSIYYTGRLETDPLNTMQTEVLLQAGSGNQTGASARWGDYSSMNVDPVDDCTFWYTTEYIQTSGVANWQTRVGSYKFPECKPEACGPGSDYYISSESASFTNGSTLVPGTQCDDCTTLINLPFPVELYGETYNNARISSNGNLQFTTANTVFTNSCNPSVSLGAAIFPLWDDLNMAAGITSTFTPGVYTATTTVGGVSVFQIEWDACLYSGLGTCNRGRADFTLRLYSGRDKFEVFYSTVQDNGNGATIGVHNQDATQSTYFSCNDYSLQPGLKLLFRTRPCTGGCDADYSIDTNTFGFVAGSTLVPGSQCDDCLVTIPLPFTYNLYGEPYSGARVSSNGTLSLTGGNTTGSNDCLPTPNLDTALMPLWDNLDMTLGITGTFTPGIYTSTSGVAPNRIFNIEWRACFDNAGACNNGRATFEIRLYEGQDKFEYAYSVLTGPRAASATVGVQRDNGTQWTSFSCNADTLVSNDRLIFTLLPGATVTDSIDNNDPTMVGRLFRDVVAATCAAPKTCPGTIETTDHHYKAYAYTNTSNVAQCVTVDMIDDCSGSGEAFSAAYLGSFDPLNLCTNYLADGGDSGSLSYSFNVPAGAEYIIVVNEVTADTGCTNFSFRMTSVDCTPRGTPTVIPTPTCIPNRSYTQGTNLTIPDASTVTSTLNIPDSFNISTIEVTGIDITHTNPSDLDVFLVSPSGTSVQLFTDVCGSTDWTAGSTGFDLADSKFQLIGSVCPPGTGNYRAEGLLSAFLGEDPEGNWSLRITDDLAGSNTGVLYSWGLRFGAGNCPTLTPVPTFTPTRTFTPTQTFTPTATPTCGGPALWQPAATIPAGRSRYGFAQNGDDLYVIGGFDGSDLVTTTFRYNATTNAWATLAGIPAAGEALGCAFFNNKIYCTQGSAGAGFYIYDVVANSWTAGPNVPGGPTDRFGAAVGAFNGNVYVVGGDGGGTTDVRRYNIGTNTWFAGVAIPASYVMGGYTTVGQYLYVIGSYGVAPLGQDNLPLASAMDAKEKAQSEAPSANGTSSYRLDMNTGVWSTGPAWTPARADFALAYSPSTNKLYAIGGDLTGGTYFDESNLVDELSLASWPAGAWATSPNHLPTARQANQAGFFSTGRVGGEIWSTGGYIAGAALTEHLYRSFGINPCPTNTLTPTHTPTRTPTNTPTNTVVVATPVLVGHVIWQGRPAQPNGLQRLPITLTLKLGATEVNYPQQDTDPYGFFTVPVGSLPNGVYSWRVKGPDGSPKALPTDPPGFLSNCGTIALAGALQTDMENSQVFPGIPGCTVAPGCVRAGDANNDDIESIVDFNIVKNTFGKSSIDLGYDNRADFDGTTIVSIVDFNLLKNNFGTAGACSAVLKAKR